MLELTYTNLDSVMYAEAYGNDLVDAFLQEQSFAAQSDLKSRGW